MLVHEVPHEVGDFAILLQNGFSRRAAILAQLCTAVGAFCGCVLGLAGARASPAAEEWLVAFTSGGFVYVAAVSCMPQLLQPDDAPSVMQGVAEAAAMCAGVGMMVLVAQLEAH